MIRVNVDISGALGLMSAWEEQIPYAVSLALNRTANDAQVAERERLKEVFRLRRESFNLQGIYIAKTDRASKDSWRVVIQVQADRYYLDKFEEGGFKLPVKGRWIWKPNPAVFKDQIITGSNPLNPHNLTFQRRGGQMIGNEQTFMIKTNKSGQLLVMQRVDRTLASRSKRVMGKLSLDNFQGGMGPRAKGEKYALHRTDGTRMLYQLVERVSVPAKLEFVETVTRTVQEAFPDRMREAIKDAIRTAK